MKLADAQASVSLVMEPEKYREFAQSSFMETREGRLPYHACAVFVKTQIDTLNRSGQGTGIEAEKELWKLRKENLRACRDAFEVLQEEALFNVPGHEPQDAESPNMAEVQTAESKASLIQKPGYNSLMKKCRTNVIWGWYDCRVTINSKRFPLDRAALS